MVKRPTAGCSADIASPILSARSGRPWGDDMNRKLLDASATLIALPAIAGAQSLQGQGVYIGLEGGASWMLNSTISDSVLGNIATSYPNLGFAAGAVVGYDFVGPRVELEGVFRSNTTTVRDANPGDGIDFSTQGTVNQWGVMANAYYDFNAGGTLVPYVGAGVGAAFLNGFAGGATTNATAFAYQGIVGVGYNVNEAIRINLDARYYGTTSPSMVDVTDGSAVSFTNNNIAAMLGLQFKFGRPAPAAAGGFVAGYQATPSWCSSTGIARTCRPRRSTRSGRRPVSTRPRARPA